MINQLKNPMTENYLELKELVLSPHFSWFYSSQSTYGRDEVGYKNIPFYKHTFLERPIGECRYTEPKSEFLKLASDVLCKILNFNEINLRVFLRICANTTHPEASVVSCIPHVDHYFPHFNLVLYLTSAGGSTVVEGEEFIPKEDDVLLFQGTHYMKTPEKDRRVVLVATFI